MISLTYLSYLRKERGLGHRSACLLSPCQTEAGELGPDHTVPRAVREEKCPGDIMKFSKRPYYKINFIIKKGTRHLFYDISRSP